MRPSTRAPHSRSTPVHERTARLLKEPAPPTTRFERFLPLSGVLAGLCFLASGVLTIKMPDNPTGDGHDYVRWLADHQGLAMGSGFASGLFCVAMLFFAAGIRQAIRSGEPGESSYSGAAFAGALGVALAVSVMGWVTLSSVQAAHDGSNIAAVALGYLSSFGWIPWVASSATLFIAAGLGGLRTAALPKPLAIVTIVLGVLCLLGPTGIAVYFATPFWLIITGVVLYRRLGVTTPQVPAQTSRTAESASALS
jgi:hypothetical protein